MNVLLLVLHHSDHFWLGLADQSDMLSNPEEKSAQDFVDDGWTDRVLHFHSWEWRFFSASTNWRLLFEHFDRTYQNVVDVVTVNCKESQYTDEKQFYLPLFRHCC